METEKDKKKRFYLKWPWNVVVYIFLVVLLRIFAIPFILLIMWWNKKQQPDGPEEGYCLEKTRRRLIGLIPAAFCLLFGGLSLGFFYMGHTLPEEAERLNEEMRIFYYLSPFLGAGLLALGIFLAWQSLRDALCPEKSGLAKSIRIQLPYPEEAPPVRKLFAMVDQDIKENGVWFGHMAVGREWVLGDEASRIPRIRGIFGRDEVRSSGSGNNRRVSRILEVWILDDRQRRQVTSLKSPKELQGALECLRQRAPAAIFGTYGSMEYDKAAYANADEWQFMELEYRKKKAQLEEQEDLMQKQQAQNQVLTFPDGSVTSRITGDGLEELLRRCRKEGETRPFQLVPGIPFRREKDTFSRLVCFPGGEQEPARLFLEEFSGTPGVPGKYGWTSSVPLWDAETILRGWLRGEVPSTAGWVLMERTDHGWQQALERR